MSVLRVRHLFPAPWLQSALLTPAISEVLLACGQRLKQNGQFSCSAISRMAREIWRDADL